MHDDGSVTAPLSTRAIDRLRPVADHVDAAIVSSVCTSNDEKVTFAGLPMFYSAANYGRTQFWEFATSNATYYLLQTTDASNDPGIQASDKSILATFRPDDMTSGCS